MQPFRQKLREATRSQHEATESLLFPHQSWETFSLQNYREFMTVQYVFHTHTERVIDDALGPELKERLHWQQRRKLLSIQNDLAELSSGKPTITEYALPLASEAEAIGYLYVTEGSTLGGRMISKALSENEQIATHCSFRFLNVYGTETGRYWKEFLDVLSKEITADQEETVITAAQRAFGLFAQSVNFVRDKALA
ncbi:MAG: biliverdin-producing heme oxygenase [Cyclobacteriaceae bacterium]